MKPHADREPLGEILIAGLAREDRPSVVRRGSGSIASVPDEILLSLGGIEALA